MKRVLSASVLGILLGLAQAAIPWGDAVSQCVPDPSYSSYGIYYHNSGLNDYCVQDNDMDIAEYELFLTEFSDYITDQYGTAVIADTWVECQYGTPHGQVVHEYYDYSYRGALGLPWIPVEMTNFGGDWCEMLEYVASNWGRNTVVNLSNGTYEWERLCTAPAEAAYAAGELLVGAPRTFWGTPEVLADKVLRCWFIDAEGEPISSLVSSRPNTVGIHVATNWRPGGIEWYITAPESNPGLTGAYIQEMGSFSTPLVSGVALRVAEAVASQEPLLTGGEFVKKVLDCLVSSCDRNVDAESYQHRLNEVVPSLGPWSPTWGYGVFSAWKAMIYTYGFGRLEPRDAALDPGVSGPPTVFSDHFTLRGDLFVPAAESLRVSPLASIRVDPTTQEPQGPSNLGLFPELREVRVAGSMEVESSLEPDSLAPLLKGVCATVVVDSGGSCIVRDGGTITIDSGQKLRVCAGGELAVEAGGEIVVLPGGTLEVFGAVAIGGTLEVLGAMTLEGTLALSAGCQVEFGPASLIFLGSDLSIPAEASLLAAAGCTITVAPTDAAAGGNDPNRVELICDGTIVLPGQAETPVVVEGENAGQGQWVGFLISSNGSSENNLSYVKISDAQVGIDIGGSAPVNVSNLTVTNCVMGIRVVGRGDVALHGTVADQGVSYCTKGIELTQSDIQIEGLSIHHNGSGIRCTESSPTVRHCDIYANSSGVVTLDPASIPDLGTVADPGHNDFFGPPPGQLNNFHISAIEPEADIYAQNNWWGTIKAADIRKRIVVLGGPDVGTVIFEPFLTGPPPVGAEGLAKLLDPGEQAKAPMACYAEQNFPNPFNPATTIRFGLETASWVSLMIFDIRGELVRVLVEARLEAGHYERPWDGKDSGGTPVATGVYFYRLEAGDFVAMQKMVLVR
jgi:hypothetical protein